MSKYFISDLRYLKDQAPRRWDVLNLVTQGYSNREIANILCISFFTVKRHMTLLYHEVGGRNRVALAMRAVNLGIVEYAETTEQLEIR